MVSCCCRPGHMYVSNILPNQSRNIYMSSKFNYGKRWIFVLKNYFLKLLSYSHFLTDEKFKVCLHYLKTFKWMLPPRDGYIVTNIFKKWLGEILV